MIARAILPSLALGLLLVTGGCPPCEQLCVHTADAYALCLGEWEMDWTDVGYAGVEIYEDACKEEAKLETGRLTEQEKLDANGECRDLNQLLRSTEDCGELYDLLADLEPG